MPRTAVKVTSVAAQHRHPGLRERIQDYHGKLKAGRGCVQSDRHLVSCGGHWKNLIASLRGGRHAIGAIIPVRFERVNGGSGSDTLRGNVEDDKLIGGPGRDTISCGSGFDVAVASPKDEVDPDCERVKRP